jgi:phosphoglycolate phosphatase
MNMVTDPEKPFEVVVFDFDGTLVESNAIKRQTYFEVAEALGDVADVVIEVIATVTGDRSRILREVVVRTAARQNLPGTRSVDAWSAELVANYSATCERRIVQCPAVAGAMHALPRLQASGCRLFVNSATPLTNLTRIIQLRALESFFAGLYGAPASKVDNLTAIQQTTDVPFHRMLMVGDGEDDRQAAREVGCAFVGIVLEERRFRGDADLVLSDLSDLLNFVAGRSREGVLQ